MELLRNIHTIASLVIAVIVGWRGLPVRHFNDEFRIIT